MSRRKETIMQDIANNVRTVGTVVSVIGGIITGIGLIIVILKKKGD